MLCELGPGLHIDYIVYSVIHYHHLTLHYITYPHLPCKTEASLMSPVSSRYESQLAGRLSPARIPGHRHVFLRSPLLSSPLPCASKDPPLPRIRQHDQLRRCKSAPRDSLVRSSHTPYSLSCLQSPLLRPHRCQCQYHGVEASLSVIALVGTESYASYISFVCYLVYFFFIPT
jgi:hypothetical protein